jgi:glycine dehydrogenase subunit 1
LLSDYTALTPDDLEVMLTRIGVDSIEDLLGAIPDDVRRREPLDLPAGRPEQEVFAHLRDLASRNTSADDEVTFLGAGMYDHYAPALIEAIILRSEFLTPYTPYQPEISQGGLQAMFEYQTAICELTGLPVSNASLYEGPSAVASAAYMAKLANGRPEFVVTRGLHPHSRQTLATVAHGWGGRVVEVPLRDGITDPGDLRAAVGPDTCAVIVQQPNFLGAVEDIDALAAVAHGVGAVPICSADPLTLGVLEAPGNQGCEIVVGEGQTLGNRLDFGGPSFGFLAAASEHIRRMPGRIAGETTDADGRRGFVLTLQTREQHIRREKATSNICTAQALNALAGVIYLAWLGRDGLPELGELLIQRTAYARARLAGVDGVELVHAQPVVREFAIRLDAPADAVVAACQERGVNPGFALERDYPEYPGGLLVAITEQRSREDIDRLAATLEEAIAAARASVTGVEVAR